MERIHLIYGFFKGKSKIRIMVKRKRQGNNEKIF